MKKKNYLKILMIIFILVLFFKACLRRDIPEQNKINKTATQTEIQTVKQQAPFETVLINGVEYRQSRGEIGKYGGVLNVSTIGEGPKTFNPWVAKDATSAQMGGLLYDSLVTTDAYTGAVIPLMAKSFSISNDGKEYTFKLRKGLKWTDGKPITADDVIFTWEKIIAAGYGNTSTRDNLVIDGELPKIYKIDNLTVKFTTKKPFAPFLREIGFSIAPEHTMKSVITKGKKEFDSYLGTSTPPKDFVTSGMFKLKRYIPAQRVEFERNPNYYMIDKKGQKLPYLDKYIFYIVGDLNNEMLKFEAGEIDIISVTGSNVARFKAMEKNSDYTIYNLGPDTGTMFLTFNMNKRKNNDNKYYIDPIKQKWFNDINFRQAVDYAIDRESIVANILRGVGAPLYTAESLSSIFLNEKLKKGHSRDLKKAKELLKKSGFYWDKNGILHDKDGNIVEFTLFTNAGNTERESTGVMVKQDLEEIGMKVNFKPIEFNVLVGKLVDSYDWEAAIIAFTGSPLEPHGGKNVWSSTGSLHLFNQRKGTELQTKADLRDWEKELDDVFTKGAETIDFKERKKIYDKYQEIVYKQKPLIYLYSSLRIQAVRNKFGNIHPTILGGVLHNLEEIYIK